MSSPGQLEPFLDLLRCPKSGERVTLREGRIQDLSGVNTYQINDVGIPLFAEEFATEDAKVQEAHYDRLARAYLENLSYPHTEAYIAYWDRVLMDELRPPYATVAEICCGAGEASWLLRNEVSRAVGVDISTAMLARARSRFPVDRFAFVQGDATRLPLESEKFDAVFMIGGVHHVNDRHALFSEIRRILKPGGRFYFREPLSDFFLWRAARWIIYRVSPALNEDTERPLRRASTTADLTQAGLRVDRWISMGFVGSCFLMNSDVLVFNRLFRFLPGIRALSAGMARFDEACLRLPGLRNAGVAVTGVASKV